MGGGASSQQKQAAASEAKLADQSAANSKEMMQVFRDQYSKINPYGTDRLQNGLPYFDALTDYSSAQNAKAYAPAYGDLNRRFANMGDQPSGLRERTMADLEANRARGFDANLTNNLATNETAKNNAAALLTGQQQQANPLGWNSNAMQGYNGIANNNNLRSGGIGGLLGGVAGGAAGAMF